MRIMIVMAELLLPLKGGCPNIHKQETYCLESSLLFGVDWKRLQVWKCPGRSEYDTHWKVISRRPRVGKLIKPSILHMWMAKLCKEGCSQASRGLYQQNEVSEDLGHGLEDAQRGCQ